MAALEERIRTLCSAYLDPFVGTGGKDYVQDFSMRLPVMVISSMLGFPESDHDQLRIWSDAQIHREPGDPNLTPQGEEMMVNLVSYYADQIQQRRHRPTDDIVSDLLAGELEEPDGSTRRLNDGELVVFIALVNLAGNETVSRLLGWAGLTLARYPQQRAKLTSDMPSVRGAVEELLRFDAPSPVQGRFSLRDTEFHGVTIPAGSKVLLVTGAAGRDEREYPQPDVFDVGRSIARHVSFGHGAHFCLGSALARVEARVAIEETLRRFPEWNVDESKIEFVHTNSVRGPASLPISF